MQKTSLFQQIESLPPEAQKVVADLVSLLSHQTKPEPNKAKRKPPLSREKFFGMWKDREDMADSVEYVRNLRRSEWQEQ